jgi:hypothetical protein
MEDFHAVCHSRTVFYPGDAQQFLEAVLNISEKLTKALLREALGDVNGGCINGRRPATESALVACVLPNSDET